MPIKSDQNTCIKDYIQTAEKQLRKSKSGEIKNSKQSTKNLSMTKEAGTGVKLKIAKTQKDDKCHQEDRQANSNPKRDASSRSPLEGKPGKKQRECKEMETNNMQELKNDETNKESELRDFNRHYYSTRRKLSQQS